MSLKNRILSLGLSAMLALAPAVSLAEGNYPAGEMTTTVISDSYVGGNQINLTADFGLTVDESMDNEKAQAVASLLEKTHLKMSFYDDFGTDRIHAELVTDGMKLLGADVLIYEDGSVQMMTNLTGKLVLTLPEGSIIPGEIDLAGLFGGEIDYDVPFEEMSATDRLRITSTDLSALILGHLLGWTSQTQMETGNLYVFDDTYFEATDVRDAVAQRMVGTISAWDFNTLFWYTAATICDQEGAFQQALADVLAENGVTRTQVRQFVDSIFTVETIDPALDFVQPSGSIPDDGALCTYDDVSYFFKKLFKCTDRLLEASTDNTLSMIVSYDDYGEMVGFDADLAKYTELLPYEGDFTYSLKTDDYFQTTHNTHGELQIYDDNRIVGDLYAKNGEDVEGVNASELRGTLDVVNKKSESSTGIGVNAGLTYEVGGEEGQDSETFSGSAALSLRQNGEGMDVLVAAVDGRTVSDGEGFSLTADASLGLSTMAAVSMNVAVEQTEYEEIAFAGGQAIDLTTLGETQIKQIKNEVATQAAGMAVGMMTHPGVLADLMTLIGE